MVKEFGQIFRTGIQQAYSLGLKLRNDYSNFITDKYIPSKLRVNTGEDNRTITTALSVLAGLYPPKDKQIWSGKLPWQPIPVHTNFLFDAVSFEVLETCPGLARYVYRHPKYLALLEQTAKKRHFVYQMTGIKTGSLYNYEKVIDALQTMKRLYPEALPKWSISFTSEDLGNLKLDLHLKFIDIVLSQTGGFLLNFVLDELENNIKQQDSHPLTMYSVASY
ncbi:unnamed protein product [Enterobius vermicularis]|uniref:ALOG domain-containing protein n=1 Tax=Enterobius vermicularis TaxID=51028 RepID=A0A0N4VMC5_ENTVE|nr:unnamed protein product [Enterobius vermicularis]